ncbi:MAG: DUF748 domain-containing protein [Candidatus Omnitrophota bacterium]|nr:DUF748 domain-containing protein [Candidatus Omnitrophota bacterium]
MKKGTFKKIAIAFLLLLILISGGIIYLNKVVLPVKIKALIIEAVEKQTGKRASLESVRFNLFKGLVLSELNLYDGQKKLIGAKEASCSFLILPILKEKKIIIPYIKIQSPYIFISREADNSINLMKLIPAQEKTESKDSPFGLIISGINILDANVDFEDNSFSPSFTKSMEGLNLSARLNLPAGVKFKLNARLKTNPTAELNAEGEFRLINKELTAKINLKNLPPGEFASYYRGLELSINQGTVDASVNLTFKDNRLSADSKIQCNKITAVKDKLTVQLNSAISAGINYDLKDQQLAYSGSADIIETHISGIEAIGEISGISAKINFNNQGLSSDKIIANYFGLNVTAKARLSDFNNPIVYLEVKSEADLKSAQNILSQKFKLSLPVELSGKGQLWVKLETPLPPKEMSGLSGSLELVSAEATYNEFGVILKNINGPLEFNLNQLTWADINFNWLDSSYKAEGSLSNFKDPSLSLKLSSSQLNLSQIQKAISERFKLKVPVNIEGSGKLALNLKTKLPAREIPQIDGSLDIASADIKITELNQSLTGVRGHLEWTQNTLNWSEVNFNYLDTAYTSEGRMKNFLSPLINLELSSAELKLKSNILLNHKLIKISALEGKYLNSNISLSGTIDTSQSQAISTDINADLELDLKDLEKPLAKFKDQLEKIKPSGIVKAKLNLNGNINDLKSAQGNLRLESSSLSLYGLKPEEFLLDYHQANRLADIPLARISLYDGSIDANAKVNLDSPSLPFKLELGVQGIKIEKLKQDTPLKTQDLSGTLEAITKLNGLLTDFSKLSGSGKILIKDGRLWQLNFFKGIGEILFTKDFANVVFNEGYCEFFIKDQFLFTDNLRLKSNIVDLEGKGKVGFDGTLDAAINAQVSEGLTPETGTLKDFTTALIGQAGRFGVIKLSGTIQEPKYKFQAAVTDVMKGLKDFVIGNIFGQ